MCWMCLVPAKNATIIILFQEGEQSMLVERQRIVTLNGVVADILNSLPAQEVENVKNTTEKELSLFHLGWGMRIRNEYLHGNERLMHNIGVDHPDDASSIIIKRVWRILRGEESPPDKLREQDIETETVLKITYHEDLEALEFMRGGTSVAIRNVPRGVAVEIASALKAEMSSMRTRYVAEDVAPRVVKRKDVRIEIWKYPKHPDNLV